MASQENEIRRLQAQLTAAEAMLDEARKDYAELAGLTQKYVEVKDGTDNRTEQQRLMACYQRGWQDCERYVDGLTRDGMALDQHGRLRVLSVPTELPVPKSLDEYMAELDDWQRREGEWQFGQHQREQGARQKAEQDRAERSELVRNRAERSQRQAHPKGIGREKAS
jgi:hypothetical protein